MTAALDEVTATVHPNTLAGLAEFASRNGGMAAHNQLVTQMHGNLGAGTHLYRVSGTSNGRDWSYVLKIFDLPGAGYLQSSADPAAWNFWEREWLAYQAPWLRALTGVVTPPTCYGSGTGTDGRLWIAIEDLADQDVRPWPFERFGSVARHFGQFNGRYLNQETPPVDEWLSRNWLQGWTERCGPQMEELVTLADNPLIAQVFPPEIAGQLVRVWKGRHSLYRALNDFEQTLCHLDVHPHNMFAASDAHTVAIDWSYVGIAHLGADLAGFVGGSLILFEVPYDQADELEALCLRSYIDGLRAGGWVGSERDVELGYYISGILQGGIGIVGPAVMGCLHEELHPILEKGFGRPAAEVLANASQLTSHWVRRIDRIREYVEF